MPASAGSVRFDWGKSLWLWSMLLMGVVFGLPALSVPLTLASLGLAFLTLCLGHSVGLHRGVIHATYRAGPVTRAVLLELFVLTGLGGPLSWARLHAVRDLFQNERDCPRYFGYRHSMARDFWWNLHLGFLPRDPKRFEARLPTGLFDDPWLRFLERSWPLHVLALALAVGALFGPEAVAAGVCLRTAAGILGHWAVGYASHVWGERRFAIEGAAESGTNGWMLGVLSFGEGFHNNHHAFPHSARMGMRWYELDLGWFALRALEALGLVNGLEAWHRPGASGGLHRRLGNLKRAAPNARPHPLGFDSSHRVRP